jgi:hypothetical protein
MPAVSERQRRWAFGVKGAAWAREHHFDVVRAAIKGRKRKRHGRAKA